MADTVKVYETVNKVVIAAPGPQGPGGRTILNGIGAPSNNLGIMGDFYYDTVSTYFYGPKLTDSSWAGATSYPLQQLPSEFSYEFSWELTQVNGPGVSGDLAGLYYVEITHNLNFKPNITVKTSAGDVLETGITYNSNNKLTLTMAQPFSGTAYLS